MVRPFYPLDLPFVVPYISVGRPMISGWNYNFHDLVEDGSAESFARHMDMKRLKKKNEEEG